MNLSFVDRHAKAVLDRVPVWLLCLLGIYTFSLIVHSLTGADDVHPAAAVTGIAYVRYVGLGFNLVLAAVGTYSVTKTGLRLWDECMESQRFLQRVWDITKKGPASAGLVGADLGKADEEGIYTRRRRGGGHLYFRMVRGSTTGNANIDKIWQWSLDRRIWTEAAKVDQYFNEEHRPDARAEKVLIRRLEVETAFRVKQPLLPAGAQPPAIELNLPRSEKQRLVENVPRAFLCPISMEIMTQPVVTPSGMTYDRQSLANWIERHRSDPATKGPLKLDHLYPNLSLRDMIQEWLVAHRFLGTEM